MPPDPNGPPGDLDTDARALYKKLRKFLQDAKRWEDSDRYLLAQTCRYEERSRRARESLPKDPQGRPILTTQGRSEFSGEVVHPNVRVMEAADKGFIDGLRELGLTPKERQRMGVEPPPPTGKFGGALGG